MLGTRRTASNSALVAALLAASVSGAGAQTAVYGAGLQAWLGCWSAGPNGARAEPTPSIVCITPTAHVDVADVLAVQDGRIVARETLDATGRSRPIDAARCTGVRSASWSRDGRRLFVRSAGACAGVPSSSSGLLAMTADGDWLDVEAVSVGGGVDVRVARYREVAPPASLPMPLRTALGAQALVARSVRVTAGAPVRAEDVLEATSAVDSAVVRAWILERAQRFEISASDFAMLVRTGLPTRVADALAAVAEPDEYTFARGMDDVDGGFGLTADYAPYALPFGWGWGYALPVSGYGTGRRHARPGGFYRPPIVIGLGHDGRRRRTGEPGRGGHPPRNGEGGGRAAPAGDPRHPGATPPAGDPRHAQPSAPAGATLRLGKPRN